MDGNTANSFGLQQPRVPKELLTLVNGVKGYRINGKTIHEPEVEELVKDKTFLSDKST